MTRKEIEKRCREQMQQSIPDKDALWARIENSLPEQKHEEQPAPKIQRSILYRTMAAAACFLFAAAGLSVWRDQERLETENEFTAEMSAAPENADTGKENALNGNGAWEEEADGNDAEEAEADNAPAEEIYPNVNAPQADDAEAMETNQLTYADLDVSADHSISDSVDRTLLDTESGFFTLPALLEETECFADVTVLDGGQDAKTGGMTYVLEVNQTYGTHEMGSTLAIFTDSPYLLEKAHTYILPLCRDASGDWTLTSTCAPQIEKTRDNHILLHNGWYDLITDDSIPVLYDSFGEDDFFYDRMYLIDAEIMEAFLYEWESSNE